MAQLLIPTLDEATAARLREEAERRHLSPEELAALLLRASLQPPRKRRKADHLAGTWTAEEADAFDQLIEEMFEQVDEEAWREPSDTD